jgi:serine/threonine protein kinase
MSINIADIVLGTYRVDRVFEGGAMGVVYQVRHLHWNCDLALKQPRDKFLGTPAHVTAFEQEVETWAALGLHPNVVTCYYSRQIDGLPCVFSEFVTGGALADWIRNRQLYEGEEAEVLARILRVSIQFARGLAWAHRKGFVHQDAKPGNVLMADDETVKVSDFGLARCLQPTGLVSGPSHVAEPAGFCTDVYASPEQLAGRPLTPFTDIWSWAVSVLEMFMGGITWHRGDAVPAAFKEYLSHGGKVRALPAIPHPIADVLSGCFRLKSSNLPQSFDAIVDLLLTAYKDLFGEDSDLEACDPEILRADSLNNRAVVLLDVGRDAEAARLLAEALKENPYHVEAIYNTGMLQAKSSGQSMVPTITALTRLPVSPAHTWRLARLLAWAWAYEGRIQDAEQSLAALPLGTITPAEQAEQQYIRSNLRTAAKHRHFALAQPRPATELSAEAARFRRLLPKAKAAAAENRLNDARRYLLMLGDLPDYSMHPEIRMLREELPYSI